MVLPTSTTTDPTTLEHLQQHAAFLQTYYGINDLAQLGSMTVSGAVMPQVGLCRPPVNPADSPYEAQTTKYGDQGKYASKISSDGTRFDPDQGDAKLLKIQAPVATPPPSAIVADAYIVAHTLNLAAGTNIILRYPNRYLTIIAENIIVGPNVTITWERPKPYTTVKPAKPAKPATAPESTTLTGITGTAGTAGTKGFEDVRTTGKGVLDGLDGAEIEVWTLDLTGHPAVDVRGQNGTPGWPGRRRRRRRRRREGPESHRRVLVRPAGLQERPRRRGQWWGGGAAAAGGRGGNGSHGGRFSLYAPQSELLDFVTGFYIGADGGAGGAGGVPGLPGSGGTGGRLGDNKYSCSMSPQRYDGTPGPRGATAAQGVGGTAGVAYSDAVRLMSVTREQFIEALRKPSITVLQPTSARVGDPVTATGPASWTLTPC